MESFLKLKNKADEVFGLNSSYVFFAVSHKLDNRFRFLSLSLLLIHFWRIF